jgi:ankyrin repeat protein
MSITESVDDTITKIFNACKEGNKDAINDLIALGTDFNLSNRELTPIYVACQYNHTEIVEILITLGVDINQAEYTSPLYIACENNNIDIVNILIAAGADVNHPTVEKPPFYMVCETNNIVLVNILIAAGANVNHIGRNFHIPLYIACENNHIDLVNILITAGADVNISCDFYNSLRIAIIKNHIEIVNMLITAGADVNQTTKYIENTPLYMASCEYNRKEIVNILITAGADICKPSRNLRKPIHCPKSLDIMKILISEGADWEAEDICGTRPLHYTCLGGYIDVVDFLINEAGADVEAVDKDNHNAYWYVGLIVNDETKRQIITILDRAKNH